MDPTTAAGCNCPRHLSCYILCTDTFLVEREHGYSKSYGLSLLVPSPRGRP